MTKNKNHFLVAIFSAAFLIGSLQNSVAQNKITESGSGDEDAVVEAATPETEHQLTIDKVDPSRFNNIAVVQGLNKITAKTSLLEIKIGDTIKFGKLIITAHKCWQSPLDQKPESKILLEIFDSGDSDKESVKTRIFYGWMFSSSPSISALEHPIYDITAVRCKNK